MINLFEDCHIYRPEAMSVHCTSKHGKQKKEEPDGEGVKTEQDGACTK